MGLDICKEVCARSGVKPSSPKDLKETGKLVKEAGGQWLEVILDQRYLPSLRKAAFKAEKEFGLC